MLVRYEYADADCTLAEFRRRAVVAMARVGIGPDGFRVFRCTTPAGTVFYVAAAEKDDGKAADAIGG